jgi:hypothetical protein
MAVGCAGTAGEASANSSVLALAPIELGSHPMRAAVPVKQTSTRLALAMMNIGWVRVFEALASGMFMMISFW